MADMDTYVKPISEKIMEFDMAYSAAQAAALGVMKPTIEFLKSKTG